MKKAVLILGATSSIARAIAGELAAKGHPLYLASREKEELERIALDLRIRYRVTVNYGFFDADAIQENEIFLQHVIESAHGLEGVVLAFGELGDQKKAIYDFSETEKIFRRNFIGACSILSYVATYFEREKHGFIIAISSVAGDRGRQSNYVYGSSKAGLNVFLQGLRNRLYPAGVHVMTVKPGFVDTAMTFGLPGLFLVATPQRIGKSIVKALEKSKEEIYVPWFWRGIMSVIKCIPEKIFKKLKL